MKSKTAILCLCFILTGMVLPANAQDKVRLFLDPGTVQELRQVINREGSHHHELFHLIRERADHGDFEMQARKNEGKGNYYRSFGAVENALLYRLTREQIYARQAFELLEAMYSSGEPGSPTIPDLGSWEKKRSGSKALTYAFPGLAYGLCYDWCREGWTAEQRSYVLDSLRAGLDDWEALFRWELYNMPTSNWVSVCRGSELIMMLCAREEEKRAGRYALIKEKLREHYHMAYGPTGFSYEGLGYIHYGVPFGLAAMLSAREIGDHSLDILFSDKTLWKLMMYSFAATADRKHLMCGVDFDTPFGEGLFGLLFQTVPPDSLPYYKYFFDHTLGIKSPSSPGMRYERRLGSVWDLIFYPDQVEAADPSGLFPMVLSDHEYGAYFFRSRWKNGDDILFSLMGHFVRHEYPSWNMAETFHISAVAYNSYFMGQTGKNYRHDQVSGLLVDGRAWGNVDKVHRDTGKLLCFEEHARGAYVILDGGEKYRNMGLSDALRHCVVNFPSDSSAFILLRDELKSQKERSYRWQLNVGGQEHLNGLMVESGTEGGVPYFLLHGRGGYLKGWCISHPGLRFSGEDPLYLETNPSRNETIFIALYAGKEEVPVRAVLRQENGQTWLELDHGYRISLEGEKPALKPYCP